MKYFLHDSNALNDDKISELFIEYGFEGVGLYYCILEKLAYQEKPIKTTVLKSQLKVGKRLEKLWSFMEKIGIICSENDETFSKRMSSYLETFTKKREKTAEKVSQWREKHEDKKNVTNYTTECNPPKEIESNINESKPG